MTQTEVKKLKALFAEFTAKPGCESQVAALIAEFTQAVRSEPGNVLFDPFTLTSSSRDYIVFEKYRDDSAFQDHLNAEHSRKFNAELAGLIVGSTSTLTWLTSLECANECGQQILSLESAGDDYVVKG